MSKNTEKDIKEFEEKMDMYNMNIILDNHPDWRDSTINLIKERHYTLEGILDIVKYVYKSYKNEAEHTYVAYESDNRPVIFQASEARRFADNIHNKQVKNEFDSIMEQIYDSSMKGEYKIVLHKLIFTSNHDALLDLGYSVSSTNHNNEVATIIDWKGNKLNGSSKTKKDLQKENLESTSK